MPGQLGNAHYREEQKLTLGRRIALRFHKTFKFQSLFHDSLNQYQACWYLFECISHGDSKYGNEIQ